MGSSAWFRTAEPKPKSRLTLMLARKAFYHNGEHVMPGEQIVMDDSEDIRGTVACGLAAPISFVSDDTVVPARYPESQPAVRVRRGGGIAKVGT